MEPWVLIAVALIFAGAAFLGRNETVRRRLACPVRKASADVLIVQRYRNPGKPVRVRSCSLLADPRRVDCGQECVRPTA